MNDRIVGEAPDTFQPMFPGQQANTDNRLAESFDGWLFNRGCVLTDVQRKIARQLLSLPAGSGKSFLIDKLYRWDNS